MEPEEKVKAKIEFARSISQRTYQLIGFMDTKASIIILANGAILAILLSTGSIFFQEQQAQLEILISFSILLILLGASAGFGLGAIFPRPIFPKLVKKDSPDEHSMIYHDKIPEDFNTHWKLWQFEKIDRILDEEVKDVHRLARATKSHFKCLRISLTLLLLAVILLAILGIMVNFLKP